MKKDLRLAYLHGSKKCYPYQQEAMTRLYHSQYHIYPKRTGKDPNRDKRNGNGSDDENSNTRNQDTPNTETPGGTVADHIEPTGDGNTEPNDNLNNNDNEREDEPNNDTCNNGGSVGVHISEAPITHGNRNFTILELLGTHPIDHPIFARDNNKSDDSDEELAGMYAFYAQSESYDDLCDDDGKAIVENGFIQVPNEVQEQQETYKTPHTENKNDGISEKDDDATSDHHIIDEDYSDIESNYESEDGIYWCRNDGDDDGFHHYLGEYESSEEDTDEEESNDKNVQSSFECQSEEHS